ncbi:MAG: PadR family transcriptional regulator [Methanobrevibacter sp.]|nr:PadR family transcriptional regulator [Methanobrevibacter sp.]
MTLENSRTDIKKDYSKITNNNFVIKSYVNGMSRFLILWIIKYNGLIHGYGILKELDKFFTTFIDEKSLKQSNPSNIYPILNKMEDLGLIASEFKIKNNRQMKYFKITDDGEYVLNYIYSKFDVIHNNPQWNSLFEDMD